MPLQLIEIGSMLLAISVLGYLAWRPEGLLFHRERQPVPQRPGPITQGTLSGCKFGMGLGVALVVVGMVWGIVKAVT